MKLVVKHAFGDYQKGAEITDQAAIESALSTNPHSVLRVADDALARPNTSTTTKKSAS